MFCKWISDYKYACDTYDGFYHLSVLLGHGIDFVYLQLVTVLSQIFLAYIINTQLPDGICNSAVILFNFQTQIKR